MELSKINIYRITHIDNMKHILQYGITHKNSVNSNPQFKDIGDTSLIHTRVSKKVDIDNGNLFDIIETITLGDFIPFYFGVKMPMLFVVQNGGNFVHSSTPPEDIIYIAFSIQKTITSNPIYYFTDGHATDLMTSFYNNAKINDLPHIIDWNAIKASYWGGQENLNIKRKKQAEFLVHEDVSYDNIIGYVCYNDQSKKKLIDLGIKENIVKVIPNAYY